jgi:hypothetical protein
VRSRARVRYRHFRGVIEWRQRDATNAGATTHNADTDDDIDEYVPTSVDGDDADADSSDAPPHAMRARGTLAQRARTSALSDTHALVRCRAAAAAVADDDSELDVVTHGIAHVVDAKVRDRTSCA